MLAAEIWHWWIGVILTIALVAMAIGLVFWYLASVSAQNHPRRKQARRSDL